MGEAAPRTVALAFGDYVEFYPIPTAAARAARHVARGYVIGHPAYAREHDVACIVSQDQAGAGRTHVLHATWITILSSGHEAEALRLRERYGPTLADGHPGFMEELRLPGAAAPAAANPPTLRTVADQEREARALRSVIGLAKVESVRRGLETWRVVDVLRVALVEEERLLTAERENARSYG